MRKSRYLSKGEDQKFEKARSKKIDMYDIGDGLTLMNVINKNENGKKRQITTYIGIEENGFVCVGNANELDAPGLYSVTSLTSKSRKQCFRF